jgi:hypothetical protein
MPNRVVISPPGEALEWIFGQHPMIEEIDAQLQSPVTAKTVIAVRRCWDKQTRWRYAPLPEPKYRQHSFSAQEQLWFFMRLLRKRARRRIRTTCGLEERHA